MASGSGRRRSSSGRHGETQTDRAVTKDAVYSASVAGASRVMRETGQEPDDKGPCVPHWHLGSRQPRHHCCVRWVLTVGGSLVQGSHHVRAIDSVAARRSLSSLLRIMLKMHKTLYVQLRRKPIVSKDYYQRNSKNVDLRCDITCFLVNTPNNESL